MIHTRKRASYPFIGITLGDAAGIGAEIVCKAAASGVLQKNTCPVIIDSEAVLLRGMKQSNVAFPYHVVNSLEEARESDILPLLPLSCLKASKLSWAKVLPNLVGMKENCLLNVLTFAKKKNLMDFALHHSTRVP